MLDSPSTRISLLAKLSDRTDLAAWQEFVGLYEPAIYRLARRRGLQDADARELTQDVLMSIAKLAEARQLTEVSSLRAWLDTATRNRIIDRFRSARNKQLRQSVPLEHAGDIHQASEIESQWDYELRREMFHRASKVVQSQVTVEQWQVFWQTAIESRPASEVAARLKMSVGHVYVTRCRVMERLRKTVEQLSAGESRS